jgi:hypothetical protein
VPKITTDAELLARLASSEARTLELSLQNTELFEKLTATEAETRAALDRLAETKSTLVEKEKELTLMQTKAAAVEAELEDFQQKIRELCEMPIDLLATAIQDSSDKAVGETLTSLLRSLASSELYKPAFIRMQQSGLDQRIQSFLQTYSFPVLLREGSPMSLPNSINSPRTMAASDFNPRALRNNSFDALAHEVPVLCFFAINMFRELELLTRFDMNEEHLNSFIFGCVRGSASTKRHTSSVSTHPRH